MRTPIDPRVHRRRSAGSRGRGDGSGGAAGAGASAAGTAAGAGAGAAVGAHAIRSHQNERPWSCNGAPATTNTSFSLSQKQTDAVEGAAAHTARIRSLSYLPALLLARNSTPRI